uniref:Rrp15p-domain-containing protein n=1 Tax=Kwoniella pini CBS 10737 TaxID=1296096 RepID=A0A1B9I201_9TREE|nr:uncharacterized protein I206_03999 [Kwoniella pini CBS 10737]OCF49478.1 hypothetical protein I206_03999 [Kwoniella pini CBS 10737]
MSDLPKLKSALKKKQSHSSNSSKAGPSTSASVNPKGKSKGSVTLSVKPTRFKGSDLESGSEGNASGFEGEEDDDDEDINMGENEIDTDEEIERSNQKDPKKSTKRKRAPTTADQFGTTLTSLLADPLTKKSKTKSIKQGNTTQQQQQQPILALSSSKPPTKSSVSIEAKARKQLKIEKEEKQDKARIQDIVEGWSGGDGVIGGQEFEKSLRKTAQRGVIKLFNAILLASKNSEAAMTSLSAQAKLKPEVGKRKEKDNILGRGGKNEDVLTKESFLDMVRKGSAR